MEPGLERLHRSATGQRGGRDVAPRQRDGGERRVDLRAPWRMTRQERQQVFHLRRGVFDELDERRIRSAAAGAGGPPDQPTGLERQTGQGFGPPRRPTTFVR